MICLHFILRFFNFYAFRLNAASSSSFFFYTQKFRFCQRILSKSFTTTVDRNEYPRIYPHREKNPKKYKISKGCLWRYVRASMSLSGYFAPICKSKMSLFVTRLYLKNHLRTKLILKLTPI
jgi:hypothetical protein